MQLEYHDPYQSALVVLDGLPWEVYCKRNFQDGSVLMAAMTFASLVAEELEHLGDSALGNRKVVLCHADPCPTRDTELRT